MEPTTGYARLGDQRIAYQVIGEGPIDLVIAPSWYSSFDVEWEDPMVRAYLRRLAEFARVIRLDRRGSGASDPLPPADLPHWEGFAEDIEAVMDELDAARVALFADGDAGPLGLIFTATHPERVQALILYHTAARFLWDEDYRFGMPTEMAQELTAAFIDEWGSGAGPDAMMPSRASDPRFRRWMAKLQRAVTTPAAAERYMTGVLAADARPVLHSVTAPALILHPSGSIMLDHEHARYLADHLETSRIVELPSADVMPYFANAAVVLEAIEEFLTGAPSGRTADRILATVLFTDVVGSTDLARRVGDRQWRGLLDQHDEIISSGVEGEGGRMVKTTGDGALATFDGPGRAIRFATHLQPELAALGIRVRTGIHTGEIELRDKEIGGLAVHLAARIMAKADPDEILVSRTVKDLVIGSQVSFTDRGSHQFKGIEGDWQLFAVKTG